jgi:N-acetylglucosaminyldiphosphoundecaprenol N-acetyl-beta-D-mannosaminyltransferase
MSLESYWFHGLKLSVFSLKELADEIVQTVENGRPKIFYGYALGFLPFIKKYPELIKITNSFDVMVTDGRFLYLFARFLDAPLKFDISIPFLTNLVFEIANSRGYSVMLLGSTKESNDKATKRLRIQYPNMIIYDGFSGGSFTEIEYDQIIEQVNKNKPDIICIGVSTPKKERFAFYAKGKVDTKIIIPFGGMIDGLAGTVKLTPHILKKLGFATIFRLFQEPRRLGVITLETVYESFIKVIPRLLFEVKLKRNKEFSLKDIYPDSF